MIRHYKGKLGEFDYDDTEFEIGKRSGVEGIHILYIGKGSSVNLPKGCIDTSYMFYGKELPKGFTLGDDFNTSKVVNMEYMFSECELPGGFTLGDKFDTSSATNMKRMFSECITSECFSLGDKFDTSNVTNMCGMFSTCSMPTVFTLGDKFDTSNVTDMSGMFVSCGISEGFLGDKFDTSNVVCMNTMFYYSVFSEGSTLGDKFDTSNVTDMREMFSNCKFPENFSLGDKFNTSSVKAMRWMFYNCIISEGFTLGDKFDTSNATDMEGMFSYCTLPESFMLCSKFIKTNSHGLLFTGTKFPSWVVINKDTTEEDIIKQLKKSPSYTCTQNFIKLIKGGKSLSEAKREILNNSNFTTDTVGRAERNLKNKLNKTCSSVIIGLFSIQDNKGEHSEYTVGEVRDTLLNKGVPKDVVMEAIVTYLENQVVAWR